MYWDEKIVQKLEWNGEISNLEEKQKIADETWEHVKVLVEKKKQELDDSVHQDELENREEFETAALKLKNTFEANKDKWCDDIYERCLH